MFEFTLFFRGGKICASYLHHKNEDVAHPLIVTRTTIVAYIGNANCGYGILLPNINALVLIFFSILLVSIVRRRT